MKRYYDIKASKLWIAMTDYVDETIDVFNINSFELVSSFKPIYDSGGKRISISDDLGLIFTAHYYLGIAAYDVITGQRIWFNKSLKNIQTVIYISNKNVLLAHSENRRLFFINPSDGELISEKKSIENVIEGSDNDFFYITKSVIKLFDFSQELQIVKIPNGVSFFKFFGSKFIYSEQYQPIRCINVVTSELKWESSVPRGYRFQSICQISENLLSGLAHYTTNVKNETYLFSINFQTGEMVNKTLICDSADFTYFDNGAKLLCSNGNVYDTNTHSLLKNMFPPLAQSMILD